MMFKKIILPILLCLFVSGVVSAQSTANWTLASDSGNVKIYYQVASCNQQQHLLFKVENTGSQPEAIDFDCLISGPSGFNVTDIQYTVMAGKTDEANCNTAASSSLFLILPSGFDPTLNNISITIN